MEKVHKKDLFSIQGDYNTVVEDSNDNLSNAVGIYIFVL